eukprot:Nk52_evm6s372 gene=Nk52_evmTU6s372
MSLRPRAAPTMLRGAVNMDENSAGSATVSAKTFQAAKSASSAKKGVNRLALRDVSNRSNQSLGVKKDPLMSAKKGAKGSSLKPTPLRKSTLSEIGGQKSTRKKSSQKAKSTSSRITRELKSDLMGSLIGMANAEEEDDIIVEHMPKNIETVDFRKEADAMPDIKIPKALKTPHIAFMEPTRSSTFPTVCDDIPEELEFEKFEADPCPQQKIEIKESEELELEWGDCENEKDPFDDADLEIDILP